MVDLGQADITLNYGNPIGAQGIQISYSGFSEN